MGQTAHFLMEFTPDALLNTICSNATTPEYQLPNIQLNFLSSAPGIVNGIDQYDRESWIRLFERVMERKYIYHFTNCGFEYASFGDTGEYDGEVDSDCEVTVEIAPPNEDRRRRLNAITDFSLGMELIIPSGGDRVVNEAAALQAVGVQSFPPWAFGVIGGVVALILGGGIYYYCAHHKSGASQVVRSNLDDLQVDAIVGDQENPSNNA